MDKVLREKVFSNGAITERREKANAGMFRKYVPPNRKTSVQTPV